MKRLIVNADDFGFTRDVNAGIIEAHTQGILTATTLMANGDAFSDAVALGEAHPSLDIGVHFVLIGGTSVLTGKPYPHSLPELVRAVLAGHMNLYDELAAQAEKIRAAGFSPTHADTHKHTHLLPPVFRAVCAVAEEYGIRFVRRPADLPISYRAPLLRKLTAMPMRYFAAKMDPGVLRMTDHFAGFTLTGHFRSRELQELFDRLPDGVTEFMTHPGHCTSELEKAPTRLKASRAVELAALTAPETRAALDRNRIVLTTYREL